jgi:transposase
MSLLPSLLAPIQKRFALLESLMDERQIRAFAGAEAKAYGRGGIRAVSKATGLAINTVRRGIQELEIYSGGEPIARVRKPGGGRKKLREKDSALVSSIDALIEPYTRGDPERPLRWTCKSVRRLAEELKAQGHTISPSKVAELLDELGYSLQSHRKRNEGKGHEDRDAQFAHINGKAAAFLSENQPVISVDTKKKELVGKFKNAGREWRPQGQPEEVNVYDIARNEGWVSVGSDHDTSEFAVESIRRWWRKMGSHCYPDAKRLLITADGGGSNASRCRLWKWCLSELSREIGLEISVCHFPPATSKWNKIEHRLFCHITQNWRGKALISHEVIVSLIAATTTKAGLKVQAERDDSKYQTALKPTAEQMASIKIERSDFHGEWNYTIKPQ